MPRSGLGVLREPKLGGVSQSFAELPPQLRALAREPRLLVLTKANTRATVHRPGYLDYIGVKKFDAAGKVVGERRFVGLYTSSAYHADPREIPLLRRKVAHVIERAGLPAPAATRYKNLVTVLQDYPRDELFQIDEDTLLETALGILRLGDRRKTRVFMRRDVYGRFYLVPHLPAARELQHRRAREDPGDPQAPPGRRERGIHRACSPTRCSRASTCWCAPRPRDAPNYDVRAIEAEIVQATRRWEDDLQDRAHRGARRGARGGRAARATRARSPWPIATT